MRNIPQRAKEAADGGGIKKTQCCSKAGLKRGPWTPEEDALLADYVKREGEGRWRMLPKKAGLLRCGKSCRLRWMNYLRPSVKRGHIAPDEEDLILRLHHLLGNRWSLIAGRIPGRTDNEIKNYWNTHLSKKLISQGIDPATHKPLQDNYTAPPNPNPNSRSSDGQHPTSLFCNNFMPVKFPYTPISSTPLHAAETLHHQHIHGHDGPSSGEMMMIGGHDQKIVELNGHEDASEDVNFCPDNDVFSSFLNSLINEDAYIHNHVIEPFDPLSSAEDKETGKHCMDVFVGLSDQPALRDGVEGARR